MAKAAPGMASLLPRGMSELLGFIRRLSAFTLNGVGANSPHVSQLRSALWGLERAEDKVQVRPRDKSLTKRLSELRNTR